MMSPTSLFVTGCYRSGTTLLDKLLNAHPWISIATQPLPLLYSAVKEAFYRERGLQRLYPLGDLFLEDAYATEDFFEFLDRFVFSNVELDNLFEKLAVYMSEDWTPQLLGMRDAFTAGKFIDIQRQLNECVVRILPKERLDYVGSKEILCEEYIPFLLEHGVKVILIVRDPRDMIASANFRRRDGFVGANRPVLYSLRIWRKSIAYALAYERHPNMRWLRYEDLAADPIQQLNDLAAWLNVSAYPPHAFDEGVYDQKGRQWASNSSFYPQPSISVLSIGQYARSLPSEVQAFIEACCRPEMLCAGYELSVDSCFDGAAITNYNDPFTVIHERFPKDYSSRPEHLDQELRRYEMLRDACIEPGTATARQWFIHESTYQRLRDTVVKNESRLEQSSR